MPRCFSVLFLFCAALVHTARIAEAGSIALAWDPNPETDIAGYVLNYGTSPGIYTQRIDVGPVTTATLTSLTDNVVYYIALSAYNTSGISSPLSREISGFPTPSVSSPITISSLTADKTFPVPTGTSITWTTTAFGGSVLEYQYWLWSSESGWVSWPYSTANRFSWTPTAADAGTHQVQVDVRSVGSSGTPVSRQSPMFTISPGGSGPTPYGGVRAAVPGTIQAENFDEGGEGVGYHDNDSTNKGGQFRSTGVDIEITSDSGGGFNVGWMSAGEWLGYSVTVATTGTYSLEARVASNGVGGSFHIEANGVNVSGPMTVPNTGAWQAWQTLTTTVTLAAGTQFVRLVVDANGPGGSFGNVNFLRLTTTGAPPPSAATNLALNRPTVASSIEGSSYAAGEATDGDAGTRWSSAFSDPQWIRVDLGTTATIQRVVLQWEVAYGRAYQVQVSQDAQSWATIASTTTGDGGVDDLSGLSASGRYVRVYATGRGTQWGYSLWEFEVYGTGSNTPPPAPTGGTRSVVWTQMVRTTANGGTLTKSSGCDGCADAGAASQQTISSGDGYVEFTAGDDTRTRVIGLSNGNPGTSSQEIAFAIALSAGIAEVRENNVYRTDTAYSESDVFRIAVEGGAIKYYKNGVLWFTRGAIPSYPLLVDTSLLDLDATLVNVVINGQ